MILTFHLATNFQGNTNQNSLQTGTARSNLCTLIQKIGPLYEKFVFKDYPNPKSLILLLSLTYTDHGKPKEKIKPRIEPKLLKVLEITEGTAFCSRNSNSSIKKKEKKKKSQTKMERTN